MKVVCRANTGKALSQRTQQIQYSVATEFNTLDVGRVCTVYGMIDWKGILEYLVIGYEGGYPSWYPAELFSVQDYTLPSEWHFRYVGNENGVMGVWGYEELVLSDEHYDRLLDQEPDAIDIFVKRMRMAEGVPKTDEC